MINTSVARLHDSWRSNHRACDKNHIGQTIKGQRAYLAGGQEGDQFYEPENIAASRAYLHALEGVNALRLSILHPFLRG